MPPEAASFADIPGLLDAHETLILIAKAAVVLEALPGEQLLLPEEENTRIARYKNEGDRNARRAAHGLLRHCLGLRLSRAPQDIHLTRDEKGRPFLDGASDTEIDFNLSHGGYWISVGISRAGRIGVDIQEMSEPFDWQPVSRAYLHEEEIGTILSLSPAAQASAALELWCLKEAFLKATGEGLATRPSLLRPRYAEESWHLTHKAYELKAEACFLADGTCAAWACERTAQPRVIRLS